MAKLDTLYDLVEVAVDEIVSETERSLPAPPRTIIKQESGNPTEEHRPRSIGPAAEYQPAIDHEAMLLEIDPEELAQRFIEGDELAIELYNFMLQSVEELP